MQYITPSHVYMRTRLCNLYLDEYFMFIRLMKTDHTCQMALIETWHSSLSTIPCAFGKRCVPYIPECSACGIIHSPMSLLKK